MLGFCLLTIGVVGSLTLMVPKAEASHITYNSLSKYVRGLLTGLRSDVDSIRDTATGKVKTDKGASIIGLDITGNVITFSGGGAGKGNAPKLNFNQGDSQLYDNGHLNIETDDNLYLNAQNTYLSGNLNVANGLTVRSGAVSLPDSSITTPMVEDGAITSAKLAAGAITGTINPSFTTGSIPFQGASGLTEDNSHLFWDNTNDRLGVGTATPGANLHIYNPSNGPSVVRIDSAASSSGGHAGRIELNAPSSPATADTKNFAIVNINTPLSSTYNVFQIRQLNDGLTSQRGLLAFAHGGGTTPGALLVGDYAHAVTNVGPSAGLAVSGSVGIGAISSLNKLTVDIGTAATVDSGITIQGSTGTKGDMGLRLKNTGTGGTEWYLDSTNNASDYGGGKLAFLSSLGLTTPTMTLTSTGVGIATASPNSSVNLQIGNGPGASYIMRMASAANWELQALNSPSRFSIAQGGVNEFLTILPTSGNVGIGITAPATPLNVGTESGTDMKSNVRTTGALRQHGYSLFSTNASYTNPFTTNTANGYTTGDPVDPDFTGGLLQRSATGGGLEIIGNGSLASTPGVSLSANKGTESTTQPAILLTAGRSDGAGGRQEISATGQIFGLWNLTTNLLTILGNGNLGITTTTPESALHVPDGKYAQFQDNNAGAPPAGDCDNDAERGRMSIDTSSNRLYICNGATRGWDYTALTE